jgi:hypothetical protein
MEREVINESIDLIDLGVASVETHGSNFGDIDGVGQLKQTGLSDD